MFLQYYLLIIFLSLASCRKHTLEIKKDFRSIIRCSLFGYEPGSSLLINATGIDSTNNQFVFVLDKTLTSGLSSYRESKLAGCSQNRVTDADNLAFLKPTRDHLVVENHGYGLIGLKYLPPVDEVTKSLTKKDMIKSTLSQIFTYFRARVNHETILNRITKDLLEDPLLQTQLNEFFDNPNDWVKISELISVVSDRYSSETELRMRRELISTPSVSSSNTTKADPTTPQEEQVTTTSDPVKVEITSMVDVLKEYFDSEFLSLAKIPLIHEPYEKLGFYVNILFPTKKERGLYGLFIHNCPKPMQRTAYPISMTVAMVEENQGTYLSSGEARLPALYTAFCIIYFVLSVAWIVYLRLSKNIIFKLHYLMFGVLLTKAIALTFHAINFHMISAYGVHERGWAIMYYITHMIRGALFFITILLIGAGWAFIKHMLTNRERTVFMIVVPLQILANIATIIIDESEEGTLRYSIWKEIFIFVDLACCAAILFPVIWSIKHLKSASQIDDKALSSLSKLRLFRHFYVMVISYVYLTRIIVYLLSITVPFHLAWVVEFFKEAITLAFIIAVGIKFRPVENNPYLQVATNEDDEETVVERVQMEEVWAQSGVTEGVSKKLSTRITEDDNEDFDEDYPDFSDEKAKLMRTKFN